MVLTKQGRGWGAGCSASGYCPVLGGCQRPGQAPAHLVLLLNVATTSSPNTKLPRAMADRVPSVPWARLMASSSPQASWGLSGPREVTWKAERLTRHLSCCAGTPGGGAHGLAQHCPSRARDHSQEGGRQGSPRPAGPAWRRLDTKAGRGPRRHQPTGLTPGLTPDSGSLAAASHLGGPHFEAEHPGQ